MSETALSAAYRATADRLKAVSGAVWGTRVYPDVAGHEATYPFVVFTWTGGGEANRVQKRDAELVLNVQCISDQMASAFTGAQQIADALNDHGVQDTGHADSLNGGTYWYILSVTEEDAIHLTETWASAVPLYHAGARYRYVMEIK